MTSTVISSSRLLRDSIETIKRRSTKPIRSEEYYALILTAEKNPGIEKLDGFTDSILTSYGMQSPVVSFYHDRKIALLFSTCDDHLFHGNIPSIISSIVSKAVLCFQTEVGCEVIVLNARHNVLAWLMTVVRESYIIFASNTMDMPIEQVELMTATEINKAFTDAGYTPELFTKEQKYGTLKRLIQEKGKVLIDTRSEKIDARKLKGISSFVFGG